MCILISLRESACRVTTETNHKLITALLGVECRSLNFTIVSNASKECELFLTTQPDTHDAFRFLHVHQVLRHFMEYVIVIPSY